LPSVYNAKSLIVFSDLEHCLGMAGGSAVISALPTIISIPPTIPRLRHYILKAGGCYC